MTSSNPIQSSTNLFRRLTWQSSVTLSVRLADDTPRGPSAGPSTERYYMQAPRYTYLPLLIPEIRENLVELALDESQFGELDESGWWFEEEPSDEKGGFISQGPCKWHWPLDLIELHSIIANPLLPSTTPQKHPTLRLILHLSQPPADKLLMPNTAEACQTQFINALKEADFVRWRNTNKVTNMRRADLESGWEGLVKDDHDLYTRMASRLMPLPIPPSTPPSGLPTIRPASTDPASNPSSAKAESSYSARALPVKIYLPDGAPAVQEVIPPLTADGRPQTILGALRDHLPLLFPTSSSISTISPLSGGSTVYPLAVPLVQGVEVPHDAEMAWLSACLCGADGWLRIGIQIRAE